MQHGTGWDKALPNALWSMRTSIHRVTGYSPYQILFARYVRTPYDFYRQCSAADLEHVTDPMHTPTAKNSKIRVSVRKHPLPTTDAFSDSTPSVIHAHQVSASTKLTLPFDRDRQTSEDVGPIRNTHLEFNNGSQTRTKTDNNQTDIRVAEGTTRHHCAKVQRERNRNDQLIG
jgi:hypothetical protein